ncbi:MAG: ABC transporter substrate-binding protein, partial [Gammaproteobacteria bacterium]
MGDDVVKTFRLGVFLCLLLTLPTASLAARVSVTGDLGHSIKLSAPAKRIVSLAPSATEIVFAAGAGTRLVGVSAYSNWPVAARKLPRIGDAFRIDLERIAALKPDLVIAWASAT